MTIAELQGRGKEAAGRISPDLMALIILILATTAAFGLGLLAGREMGKGGGEKLWIEDVSQAPQAAAAVAAPAPAAPSTGGAYVASKSGAKYYLPSCSSAKRIKEENKVWFATKEAAVAAGYEPAANCPGL